MLTPGIGRPMFPSDDSGWLLFYCSAPALAAPAKARDWSRRPCLCLISVPLLLISLFPSLAAVLLRQNRPFPNPLQLPAPCSAFSACFHRRPLPLAAGPKSPVTRRRRTKISGNPSSRPPPSERPPPPLAPPPGILGFRARRSPRVSPPRALLPRPPAPDVTTRAACHSGRYLPPLLARCELSAAPVLLCPRRTASAPLLTHISKARKPQLFRSVSCVI